MREIENLQSVGSRSGAREIEREQRDLTEPCAGVQPHVVVSHGSGLAHESEAGRHRQDPSHARVTSDQGAPAPAKTLYETLSLFPLGFANFRVLSTVAPGARLPAVIRLTNGFPGGAMLQVFPSAPISSASPSTTATKVTGACIAVPEVLVKRTLPTN